MTLNDAELAALSSGMRRIGIFFRLAVDPVVRIWLGIGDIEPGVNTLDPEGETYSGLGAVQNVPAFKQMINGTAERVEFTASGVSGRIFEVASSGDQEQVKGKALAVGFALMDADWQLLGTVKWCANYTADYLRLVQPPVDSADAPIVRSVILSASTLLTGRRRPSYSYWSDQDQQARFPGDRFCERVPLYGNNFNKSWPNFP